MFGFFEEYCRDRWLSASVVVAEESVSLEVNTEVDQASQSAGPDGT